MKTTRPEYLTREPKSTRHLTILALVIAVGVHAVVLLGLRVMPLQAGSWAARQTLLWITSPRRDPLMPPRPTARRLTMPLQQPDPASRPRYIHNRGVDTYLFDSLQRQDMPLVYLARHDGTKLKERKGTAAGYAPARQWRIRGGREADAFLPAGWREEPGNVPAGSIPVPEQPLIVALSFDDPGGLRQIAVLESSGSSVFDTAACAMLRTLPYPPSRFSSRPGQLRAGTTVQVILAISLESRETL